MHLHPDTLAALGKLRAEEFIREAGEWRTALLATESSTEQRGGLVQALASWRSYLRRGRADSAHLAEQEES
jgi:hypothetical protein